MREVLWKVGDAWCAAWCWMSVSTPEEAEARGLNGCRGMLVGLALDVALVALVVGVMVWLW